MHAFTLCLLIHAQLVYLSGFLVRGMMVTFILNGNGMLETFLFRPSAGGGGTFGLDTVSGCGWLDDQKILLQPKVF